MKEILIEKIKYLLDYKLNVSRDDVGKYRILLENLLYYFMVNMSEEYNYFESDTKFYNYMLNKLNQNIKSIIIPADKFNYHPYGFLEIRVSLNSEQQKYFNENLEITKQMREDILKQVYDYQFLKVIKNNGDISGFCSSKNSKYKYIDDILSMCHAIKLSGATRFYKKEYTVVYPDGTNYEYYIYTKSFTFDNLMSINVVNIFEIVFGSKILMEASLNSDINKLEQYNYEYDHLFENLKNKNNPYTSLIILEETLKRMENEKNMYKKCEYYKNILSYLIDSFNYKVTKILNSGDDDQVKQLLNDIRTIEENILYNSDVRLNNGLDYIKNLKNIKIKVSNYLKNNSQSREKDYTIYSPDKSKKRIVKSTVQPIHIDNKCVLLHVLDIKNIGSRILVKLNINIIDFDLLSDVNFNDFYITLKEFKHLFSSTDLGVFTKESEVIRTALANRIINDSIMDVISRERNKFIGEFIYSLDENRCIIYKNKSIEDYLSKQ